MKHECTRCHALTTRYQSGLSLAVCAAAVGISTPTARHWLRLHGVEMRQERTGRPPGKTSHKCTERCEGITARYRDTRESLETIALAHGITAERVRQIVRYHGAPIREQGGAGRVIKRHVCDEVCAALLAEPQPIVVRHVADRTGWPVYAVAWRMKFHDIAVARQGHQCKERCRAMSEYLAAHPDVTSFGAASALGIPSSWAGNVFKIRHPQRWRVRSYRIIGGRRMPALAAERRA